MPDNRSPYVPPAESNDIGSACNGGRLAAWFTNPLEASMLGGPDVWPPWPSWRFDVTTTSGGNMLAPKAWWLAMVSTFDNAFASKQTPMNGPDLTYEYEGTLCTKGNVFSRRLSTTCQTRTMPAQWANDCPLKVGGTLPCWQLAQATTTAGHFHGCPADNAGASEGLSRTMQSIAGDGPPNPACLTIFPPSWRLADWVVAVWISSNEAFNPVPMAYAGVIIGIIFGILGVLGLIALAAVGTMHGWKTDPPEGWDAAAPPVQPVVVAANVQMVPMADGTVPVAQPMTVAAVPLPVAAAQPMPVPVTATAWAPATATTGNMV